MSKLKPLGPNLISRLLSLVYAFAVLCRNLWYDCIPGAVKRIGRYTISIGCIHAGGTGKTPLARLIGDYFLKNDYETIFLSRGYKRKSYKHIIVKPGDQKSWEDIGDEPAMLHSSLAPAWLGIGADRYQNAAAILPALSNNAVFILDDGFQHRKIFRDKNIVCLPSDPYNDCLIPAGTLREPFSSLKRADIICIIGLRNEADILKKNKHRLSEHFPAASVFILYQSIDQWINTKTGETSQTPPLKSPLLISGIARPHRFVTIVRESGVIPYNYVSYEDHHVFTSEEIEKLYSPEIDGILTTEKDIMRLSTINLVNCPNICYLKIKLIFSDESSERKFFSCFIVNN